MNKAVSSINSTPGPKRLPRFLSRSITTKIGRDRNGRMSADKSAEWTLPLTENGLSSPPGEIFSPYRQNPVLPIIWPIPQMPTTAIRNGRRMENGSPISRTKTENSISGWEMLLPEKKKCWRKIWKPISSIWNGLPIPAPFFGVKKRIPLIWLR